MKRLLQAVTALVFGLTLMLIFQIAQAGTPTVTESSRTVYSEGFRKYVVYTYTWSQTMRLIANPDTVILGPFRVGGLFYVDSLITVEFHSTETSADSVNYNTAFQFTSKVNPNAGSSSKDWVSVLTDASNPDTPTANFGARPRRKTASNQMRILFFQDDTNGVTPATITNTARVVIPLFEK